MAAHKEKRILVVEDDDSIRETMVELLEGEGYRVDAVGNGQLALDHLRSEAPLPGLVLLDLMMPVMDGFQFCDEWSKTPDFGTVPIVIMSADGHVEEKRTACGAVQYLKKPVDLDDVLDAIARHCR